jgi:zinc protease
MRERLFRGGVAMCALLAVAGCTTLAQGAPPAPAAAAAAATKAEPAVDSVAAKLATMPIDIPYTKYTLKNGLTLIVHEDTRTPTVNIQVYYHVGSKNEPEGKSGFAHLFEHLMFNGSENFNDDFFKATQKIGATNQNGTTNTDRTNYFQTVPKEALDTILWLESDRMGYLLGAVDQARLDEQRGVVQNEKRQGENQPYGQVFNRITAAMYPTEHPYGHTVIGSMEDLEAASLNDVRDWFRSWYGAANAVIVLAGDIRPEDAKARVEKYFGEVPPGPPVTHPKAWTPSLANSQREEMFDRVAQPRIYRLWHVPELGHVDGEPLDAYANALAGDKNARLTRRLMHDEQIATSVSAFNSQSEISGLFQVVVTAKPDADLAYIEKVIDEEMSKLMEAGPTAAELDKVKVQTVRGMVDTLERASSKAGLLATWETLTDDASGWKTSMQRLNATTPQSVAAVSRKWLQQPSYTLTVKPFPSYSASGEKVDRSAAPTPPPVADANFPRMETATLSNGMNVHLIERRETPVVNIRMIVDTGYSQAAASLPEGTGELSVGLMDEGTASRTGLQIADELDRLGAYVAVGGGGETSSVEMSALTATLDPVMAIFADVARNPAFREADFKRLQAQSIAGVRQALNAPNAIAGRVLSEKLWGETHPYGRSPTPESLAKVTQADVAAFHKTWFGPNNARIMVVGDTTMPEITAKLEAAFKDWAPAAGKPEAVPAGVRPGAPKVYLVDRPGALQSVILVGSVQDRRTPALDFRTTAFNDLFGGNFASRVNMNLREDKGWSYGARTSVSGGRGPRSFIVSAPVQTDATKGALAEIRKELTDVVGKRLPSAAEVESAKTNTILGLSSRWEPSGTLMGAMTDMALFNLPVEHYTRFGANVRDVTLADVQATARTLIPDQNHVWVIVGDRAKIEQGVREVNLGELQIVDALGDLVP